MFFFSNEELDKDDYLLNLQNGTLDLSENEPRFIEHSPDLLLSKICNIIKRGKNIISHKWRKVGKYGKK